MSEIDTTTQTTDTSLAPEVVTTAQPDNFVEPPKNDSAELLRMKAALDKAAKEAADYKKQLRAKQTEEEARAEEERARQEAIEQELNELRKQSAVSSISKRVMGFLGDETLSTTVAEYLYGAADTDAAVDAIQKAWAMREKKLRMEYGKIPAPESGDGTPSISKEQLSAMTYAERADFARKYPDLYEKLKG